MQPSMAAGGAGIRDAGCNQDWAGCAHAQTTCECAHVSASSTMNAARILIFCLRHTGKVNLHTVLESDDPEVRILEGYLLCK